MKRTAGLLFLSVLLILIHISCDETLLQADHFSYVSGNVYDSITGLPLDSVKITFDDTTSTYLTYTDSSGYFYKGTLGTEIEIYFRKESYQTKSLVVNLKGSPPNLKIELSK